MAVPAVAGVLTGVLPDGPALRRFLGLTGPAGEIPRVTPGPSTVERVSSVARGRTLDLVITRPPGAPTDLPVCLALHGRGVGARWFLDLGVPQFLAAAALPFAVVAVDGGSSYFVAATPGDDPQRMLARELPGWLAERDLRAPSAVLGISMGAFGALSLARTRRDLRAVAVAAPALFTTWAEASGRDAFASQRQWAEEEPLRHTDALAGTPLGIWCGTEDPFVDAARTLAARTRPALAAVTSGAHDEDYFRRVLPDMLAFVGEHVTAPPKPGGGG